MGLYSYGRYTYGLYSYGLYDCGPYSYGLYSYGLYRMPPSPRRNTTGRRSWGVVAQWVSQHSGPVADGTTSIANRRGDGNLSANGH